MTTMQAQQIHGWLKLTSAFYCLGSSDEAAGLVILDARKSISEEMDGHTLVDATTLCSYMYDDLDNSFLRGFHSRRAA